MLQPVAQPVQTFPNVPAGGVENFNLTVVCDTPGQVPIECTVTAALVSDPADYNRDSFVDGTDMAIARDNNTNFITALKLLDFSDISPASEEGGIVSQATSSSVEESEKTASQIFHIHRIVKL